MAGIIAQGGGAGAVPGRPDLHRDPSKTMMAIFAAVLLAGLAFAAFSLNRDISGAHVPALASAALALLGLALLTALLFEFVNGFHDTANAVATVIYTHALSPAQAVLWSGLWNFLGVLTASGAVAFSIIALLPVELILQPDPAAGFAMIFAILIAAIVWNLGTWSLGLPSSSSHTLIGSIIGVGVANQLMNVATGASGVEWGKAKEIGLSLLVSPIMGFVLAGLLLLLLKRLVKMPELYREPEGMAPPPPAIRGLLVVTCTLVSFFHGSNDGQKGMGLIMLILIGAVPTAYALNRDVPEAAVAAFAANAIRAESVIGAQAPGASAPAEPRAELKRFLQTKDKSPATVPALAVVAGDIGEATASHATMAQVPESLVGPLRSDMYMVSASLRLLDKRGDLSFAGDDEAVIKDFLKGIDKLTRFIPTWVKVVIALALGLGTIVGWKRIVITVGEKIGKSHLTYAQGASAELVAAGMIGVADGLGLPVSTTHVLSSGVAGTMAANGSGLQMSTVRNLVLAWVLTLPVSILLSGVLYYLFLKLV
jgi:PiT family inorganic phosphate transporter